MKILFIASNIPSPKRKSNAVILRIANLLSVNHEVDVIFPKEIIPFWLRNKLKFKPLFRLNDFKQGSKNIRVFNYLRLPIKSMAFIFIKWFKLALASTKKYDLIHAHFLFPDGLIAQETSKEMGIPYVVSVRYSDIALLDSVSESSDTFRKAKSCLINASSVHVLNTYTGNLIQEKLNIPYRVIPHGIDLPHQLNCDYSDDLCQITCVAEFISLKQIDWVINAVKSYKRNRNIALQIVGKGPLENQLKALKEDDDRIQFLGHIPHQEVLNILMASNIFVMPSTKETFGLVYLEAAATHNAIIAYHKYSINGIFEANEEAIFCAGYADFKDQLYQLVENPIRVSKLADAALLKVRDLTWDKIIMSYSNWYYEQG